MRIEKSYQRPTDLALDMLSCRCDWDIIVATVADLFRMTILDAESAVFDAVAIEAANEADNV